MTKGVFMKKSIIALATIAVLSTSFQANAAIGLINMLTGGTATIALSGLGIGAFGIGSSIAMGVLSGGRDGIDPTPFLLLGLIVLDGEKGQEIQFKEMDLNDLKEMGLNRNEALAYNQNTEELSQAFRVVQSELTPSSTAEDSKKLWEVQAQIHGEDALNGAKKVLAYNLNKK